MESSRHPGIQRLLDSPTLARVERAMLRHEDGSQRETSSFQRPNFTQVIFFFNYLQLYFTCVKDFKQFGSDSKTNNDDK